MTSKGIINLTKNTNSININKLAGEIIESEDKVLNLEAKLKAAEDNHNKIITSMCDDMDKNFKNIKILQDFIYLENEKNRKEIIRLDEEKIQLSNILKELELEIRNMKNNLKSLYEDENKKDKIQINSYEKILEKNENIQKSIELSLNELKISKNQLSENLLMLKEEKRCFEINLINLISKKESLEEIIDINNFSLFNTLYSQFNNSKTIEFTISCNELLVIINHPDVIKQLYENISDNFSHESNLRNINNFDIDCESFQKILKKTFKDYKECEGLLTIEDFFLLITKKIYDLLYSANTSLIKDFNIEKMRIFLRHFFKVYYYEIRISTNLSYLNNDYKNIKKEKEKEIALIDKKVEKLFSDLDDIESKDYEIKQMIDELLTRSNEYEMMPALKPLENKFNSIIENKNEITLEIINRKTKKKNNLKFYHNQIAEIEKINSELLEKKEKIIKEMDSDRIIRRDKIILIRNRIASLFSNIKKLLKHEGDIYNIQNLSDIINSMAKIDIQDKESDTVNNNSSSDRLKSCTQRYYKVNSNNNTEYPQKSSVTCRSKSSSSKSNTNLNKNSNDKNHLLREYIKKLKREISEKNSNNNYDEVLKKSNLLLKGSVCFKRFLNFGIKQFDASDQNMENLSSLEDLGFSKEYIILESSSWQIQFFKDTKVKSKSPQHILDIIEIEKTVVTKNIKNIINIHQIVKKLIKEKIDPYSFFRLREKDSQTYGMTEEILTKSINNKYFNFYIQLYSGDRIEIILLNFTDFKNWLNGLACLIKNKHEFESILVNSNILNDII